MSEADTSDTNGTAPLAAALARFQSEMPTVAKTHEADTGTYRYRYADLADITSAAMPLLTKHGLSFSCPTRYTEHGYELVGVLLHESGESMEGALPIAGNTPQALGSAITYARRYLFGCMTGVVTDDDDDGRLATQATTAKAPRKRAAPSEGGGSAKQIRMIGALMRELGITDRALALEYVADTIGRRIGSRNELTGEEASKVIDALQTRGAPARTVEERPSPPADPWAPLQGSTGPPSPADPDADYLAAIGEEPKPVGVEDVPLPAPAQTSDTTPPVAPQVPPVASRVPASTARRIERLLQRELGDVATEVEQLALIAAVLGYPVTSVENLTREEVLRLGAAFDRFKDGTATWAFDPTWHGPTPRIHITTPPVGDEGSVSVSLDVPLEGGADDLG